MDSKLLTDNFPANLRVLVAEDNPTNLKVANLILRPFVSLFDSAVDGVEAVKKFKENKNRCRYKQ